MEILKNSLSNYELSVLSSIVQVGDAAYNDLIGSQRQMFGHPFFKSIRGSIRTKLVQMQCEIESHEPNFPFVYSQRTFDYGHIIPELHTKNILIHIARSSSPDRLPTSSKYKVELSNSNSILNRQIVFEPSFIPPYALEPFYGLLVFGGKGESFATIQFPSPGYYGIVDHIDIPKIFIESKTDATFERKRAGLKREFLSHGSKEAIS